jgi:hypothetical protein
MGLKNMQVVNNSLEDSHQKSFDDAASNESEEDLENNRRNRSFVLFEKLKYAKNSKLLYI